MAARSLVDGRRLDHRMIKELMYILAMGYAMKCRPYEGLQVIRKARDIEHQEFHSETGKIYLRVAGIMYNPGQGRLQFKM